MAQDFVGSNNVNLLAPCGQFGTRIMGGKDAASPRYIFTKLENVARKVFHPDDDFVRPPGGQITSRRRRGGLPGAPPRGGDPVPAPFGRFP